ncbi:2-amino-4-hydroxy-6-hydroxymethyldihydropteridine diphosphokinase [Microbacterium sp. GXF7504]
MSRRLAQGIRPQTAVVAFGANLGDREATIVQAAEELRAHPLVDSLLLAEPVDSVAVKLDGPDTDAPAYLNTVALVRTRLAPSTLLRLLHDIEARHGRVRVERWGDRTLDLDLIAYGDVVSDDPALQVPHPRAAERDFVLRPWLSIDPEAKLPGSGRVSELLARLEDAS